MAETQDYHIIEKFREMVEKRYEFNGLKQRFELPEAIDETVILEIKNYFLTTIYPPAQERKELEEAFRDLADYIKQPRQMWNLFGDMARAVFKFGRHFMTALKAGMDALDSFMGAKNFEASMAEIANKNGILPPMTDELKRELPTMEVTIEMLQNLKQKHIDDNPKVLANIIRKKV